MRRALLALALALVLAPAAARADAANDVVAAAEEAIKRGATREAIEAYEAFADRGGAHPDVSFDRGVAYLTRARSPAERPGDLGRAAAAFEETLALRPGDRDAELALDAVRTEVAHRRARGGAAIEVAENQSATRAIVSLLPERVWAALALGSSLVLALGLALRRASTKALHLAGSVGWGLGLAASLACAPLAAFARHVRQTTEIGVVVVPEARLLDDNGAASARPPIPEAARVDVTEHRGGLLRVRWGASSGLTPASNVRITRRSRDLSTQIGAQNAPRRKKREIKMYGGPRTSEPLAP